MNSPAFLKGLNNKTFKKDGMTDKDGYLIIITATNWSHRLYSNFCPSKLLVVIKDLKKAIPVELRSNVSMNIRVETIFETIIR